MLSIFVRPDINLIDQLVNLSYLSFFLLFIFRLNKTIFSTTNLYCDLQATIQDAYVCTANFKSLSQKLGKDQLESAFSNIRTQTHSSNCDLLELSDRIKIALQIDQVYIAHANWRPVDKLYSASKETDDKSSLISWCGDISTNNAILSSILNLGENKAKECLKEYGFSDKEFNINPDENIIMLSPFGTCLNNENDFDAEL